MFPWQPLFNKQDFVEANGESLVVVQEMLKTMKALFAELVEFYCLDPKKTVMEEFFALVYKFVLEYQVQTISSLICYS